jgi:hypothetical protein
MNRTFTILSLLIALALSVTAQDKPAQAKKKSGDPAVEQKLTQMEKDLWEAWKDQKVEPFKKAMADESISVGSTGVSGTEQALNAVTSGDCKVAAYNVDQPQFMWIDKNSVLMAYRATQDATCGGQKVPPEVWASSVWVKHGNDWKAVFHQETPAAAKKSE